MQTFLVVRRRWMNFELSAVTAQAIQLYLSVVPCVQGIRETWTL